MIQDRNQTGTPDGELPVKQIEQLANLFRRNELVVFLGSATSMAFPSNLPPGTILRDAIITSLCNRYPATMKYLETIIAQNLNPEMTYQIILDNIGNPEEFLKTHDILNTNRFNFNHLFVARTATQGLLTTIITTNFDHLIENALQHLDFKPNKEYFVYKDAEGFRKYLNQKDLQHDDRKIHIIKLHGTIEDKESMTVTINQAGKGLPLEQSEILDILLKEKHFLFVGYSGNDIDIYPKLKDVRGKGIIWNLRPRDENPYVDALIKSDSERRQKLEWDLNQLCEILAKRLGFKIRVPYSDEELDEWANEIETSKIVMGIGRILSHIGEIESALHCEQECLEICRETGNINGVIASLVNIGETYSRRHDGTKALEYYQKALDIAQEVNNQQAIAIIKNNIGVIYAKPSTK